MSKVVEQNIAGVSRAIRGGLILALIVLLPQISFSEDYASPERTRGATGYYSRARTMLVEALAEFEQGRKMARPDVLIDSEEFRLTLISLTEQLNRVIDPKPRVTQQGVVFRGNPRLIRRERDRTPPVADGARSSNIEGETRRLKELEAARARLYEPQAERVKEETAKVEKSEATNDGELSRAERAAAVDEAIADAIAQETEVVSPEASLPTREALPETEPTRELTISEEDEKIAAAIEEVVKERLRTLESDAGGDVDGEEDFDDIL